MKLKRLQDVDHLTMSRIFKQSLIVNFIVCLFCLGCISGAIYGYCSGDLPLLFFILLCFFLAFFAVICLNLLRKSSGSANWLVSVRQDRLLIKFRSYLNSHFPASDLQVIQLDPEEIKSACITKQILVSPGKNNGKTQSYHTFLDLNLYEQDMALLVEQLRYERRLKKPPEGKSHITSCHNPVSVVNGHTIRIEWRSPRDFIVPGVRKALLELEKLDIVIGPQQKEKIDLTVDKAEEKAKSDDKIINLIERGNVMAAIRLTRQTYGLSLTDAKKFVDDLSK